jgi:hypothetical protein
MTDDKYIEMVRLSAQIEALRELPYNSVYKEDAQLNNLQMKSAVFMDDVIKSLSEKRDKLSQLNGSAEIGKLKAKNKEQTKIIEELQAKLNSQDEK